MCFGGMEGRVFTVVTIVNSSTFLSWNLVSLDIVAALLVNFMTSVMR